MAFLTIIIGVLTFTQICFGQTSNGQNLHINVKQSNLQVADAANAQNKTDITNLCANFINLAADHFKPKKLSTLQSGNQPPKAVIENRPNIVFSSIPKQQTLQQPTKENQSNIQQKMKLESPKQPDIYLGRLNSQQNPNVNTIQVIPAKEPLPNSNILPAPNIENQQTLQNTNNFVPATVPNIPSIKPPSMTITTSLSPSFIPKTIPPNVFVQNLPNRQDTSVVSPNKMFLALQEAPESVSNTSPLVSTYPQKTEDTGEKSLNLKMILPLILNLMTEKVGCSSCSRCNCCCNSNNNDKLMEMPQIDSEYSRRRIYYGPSSEELDTSEELNRILVKRIKNKIYKSKKKVKSQRNHVISDEDYDDSQSVEDYYNL